MPTAGFRVGNWTGSSCVGYELVKNSITFTNPTTSKACTANFIEMVTVGAAAVGGGKTSTSCGASSCTVDKGNGSVTLTALASAGFRFGRWDGPTCIGYRSVSADGSSITFTNPQASAACTAVFIEQVTISAVAVPAACGSVSSNCGPGATCIVDRGFGTVQFWAVASPGYRLGGWSGSTCLNYAPMGTMITFNNPVASSACTANFVPVTP
jgi:hypothetical protein